MELVKPERIWVKDHPSLNEKWVQSIIEDDPSILGLGELDFRDKERRHPRAGRLDLLLEDSEANRRYEVEIQLGATNESHIIRTIEYWDIERKRYPQYDHCAVIVAEDITSRFLNVIGLFNGFIPIVAIQFQAMMFNDKIALIFTTVLDEMTLGEDEGNGPLPRVDRGYWETKRGTKETVALADGILDLIHSFSPEYELNYNKYYIGLVKQGQPNNFVIVKPKKKYAVVEIKLAKTDEVNGQLEDSDLDVIDHHKSGRWRIRLKKKDILANKELLTELLKKASNEF